MTHAKKLTALLGSFVLAASIAIVAAPASAAATSQALAPAAADTYCVVLLDKQIDVKTGTSKILERKCSAISIEDARSKSATVSRAVVAAGPSATDERLAAPSVATETARLAVGYSNSNFSGATQELWGNYGTCDTAGYNFSFSLFPYGLQSMRSGGGRCNRLQIASTVYVLNAPYIWNTASTLRVYGSV